MPELSRKSLTPSCAAGRSTVAAIARGMGPSTQAVGSEHHAKTVAPPHAPSGPLRLVCRTLGPRLRQKPAIERAGRTLSAEQPLLQVAEGDEDEHGAKYPEQIEHHLGPSIVAHVQVILVQLDSRDH